MKSWPLIFIFELEVDLRTAEQRGPDHDVTIGEGDQLEERISIIDQSEASITCWWWPLSEALRVCDSHPRPLVTTCGTEQSLPVTNQYQGQYCSYQPIKSLPVYTQPGTDHPSPLLRVDWDVKFTSLWSPELSRYSRDPEFVWNCKQHKKYLSLWQIQIMSTRNKHKELWTLWFWDKKRPVWLHNCESTELVMVYGIGPSPVANIK